MSNRKIIVLTGAATGMGVATIKTMREKYDNPTFICVTRNKERTKSLFDNCDINMNNIVFAECDLTHCSKAVDTIDSILKEFHKVDILINMAGLFVAKPFLETEEFDYYAAVDSNLKTCYTTTKAILPYMLANKGGAIVNISSVLGIHSIKGCNSAIYNAAKAGVIQLTKSLAVEFGNDNIKVNCICPGIIAPNESLTDGHNDYATIKSLSSYLKEQPLKKLGRENNIADAIVFLTGEESEWTTGIVLSIDGGIIL